MTFSAQLEAKFAKLLTSYPPGRERGAMVPMLLFAQDEVGSITQEVIEEIARLPDPRPFVLLAGEEDGETSAIRNLARERLGASGHSIRTVRHSEVADLYRASDMFVLSSLAEAQGRALIEASAHGLPCFAHDSPITRFAVA